MSRWYTEDTRHKERMITAMREGPAKAQDYVACLLRIWRVGSGQQAAWRAPLKSASTGQQVGFARPEELLDYLQAEMGVESSRPKP